MNIRRILEFVMVACCISLLVSCGSDNNESDSTSGIAGDYGQEDIMLSNTKWSSSDNATTLRQDPDADLIQNAHVFYDMLKDVYNSIPDTVVTDTVDDGAADTVDVSSKRSDFNFKKVNRTVGKKRMSKIDTSHEDIDKTLKDLKKSISIQYVESKENLENSDTIVYRRSSSTILFGNSKCCLYDSILIDNTIKKYNRIYKVYMLKNDTIDLWGNKRLIVAKNFLSLEIGSLSLYEVKLKNGKLYVPMTDPEYLSSSTTKSNENTDKIFDYKRNDKNLILSNGNIKIVGTVDIEKGNMELRQVSPTQEDNRYFHLTQ